MERCRINVFNTKTSLSFLIWLELTDGGGGVLVALLSVLRILQISDVSGAVDTFYNLQSIPINQRRKLLHVLYTSSKQ